MSFFDFTEECGTGLMIHFSSPILCSFEYRERFGDSELFGADNMFGVVTLDSADRIKEEYKRNVEGI